MHAEVVIAIVSGLVAIVGGLISWMQAIRTSRLKADADSAVERIRSEGSVVIEKLKVETERRRKAFEIASQESRPIESALSQAWHDIQTVKDFITRILETTTCDKNLVRRKLSPANLSLAEGYARWGTELPQAAKEAWHKARSVASSVEAICVSASVDGTGLELSAQLLDHLREIRLTLTDSQMVIAATRQTLRDVTARRIFEIL